MSKQFDQLTKPTAQSVTRRAALKEFAVGLAGMALACSGLDSQTVAAATFFSIDYPGSVFTAADDINNNGVVTGWYIDTAGVFHGYILDNGVYTSVDFPGAGHTSILGVNANGDVVGAYNVKEVGADKDVRGYLLRNGTFMQIDVPGGAETRPIGINRAGDIVGLFSDQKQGKHHGFLLHNGEYTAIDYPGSDYTDVWKINDNRQIAGRYRTSGSEKFHLFLWNDGVFLPIPDFAGATQMSPTSVCSHHSGLNGAGDMVTAYADDKPVQNNGFNDNMLGNLHGLLWSGGVYTPIDVPGAVTTVAYGINDGGNIVGCYRDASGRFHGYVRTP